MWLDCSNINRFIDVVDESLHPYIQCVCQAEVRVKVDSNADSQDAG